ncbi:MAG: porin [Oceanospirillaceae bacterium]|nr:porin [Oceanospirillaceae bacterium]
MMKKIKLSMAISIPCILSQLALAENTSETTVSKPNFNLFTSLGVLNIEDKDFDPEAFETELGVKGNIKSNDFKMIYNVKVDLSDAINSRDTGGPDGEADIHVKETNMIFPTSYGTFILAPRAVSGQYRDLYSNVDYFEYNEAHSGNATPSGNTLFAQASEGSDVIAWASPKFYGIKFVAATLSVKEDNHNDLDVKSFRAIYNQGGLNFGVGHVIASKTLTGATKDYKRSAITAGYKFDKIDLGTTYEINTDTFGTAGDYKTLGLAARYYIDDSYSVAAAYYQKDSDIDSKDNKGTVFQVKKQIGKSVSLWAEVANYDITPDNVALGINLSY